MNIYAKRILSIVISIFLISNLFIPVFAVEDDKVEIKMTIGSDVASINGKAIKIEKPFVSKGNAIVPLVPVLQAFGAELNWKGTGQINIVYRSSSIDFAIGTTKYSINKVAKELPVAPMVVNGKTMVPIQLIGDNLGAVVKYNPSNKSVSIVLEDDGALSDLSFLTGGITKAKVGNSYFGWSINVPKSSRITENTFNSKYVTIENDHRQISLEVIVDINEGKELEDYYKESVDAFESDSLIDSSLNEKASPAFAEFLYTSTYDEAIVERVYLNKQFIYRVVLTSFNESNPERLRDDKYYSGIMNSFVLGYKHNARDIEDISKVKYGVVGFDNYIIFDSYGNKYYTWSMDVPPEWDALTSISDQDPLRTRLGLNSKEYVDVKIEKDEEDSELEDYVDKAKDVYDSNFNPKYYKFIEQVSTEIAGYKAFKLVSSIQLNGQKYIIDEHFIKSGDYIYSISIKLPEGQYENKKEAYYKALNTFKVLPVNDSDLDKDLESYNDKSGKSPVGKDDKLTDIQNKKYKWSAKIPGNWQKYDSYDEALQMYVNPISGMAVTVQAVEKSLKTKDLTDEEKFRYLGAIVEGYDMEFIKKEPVSAKNTTVTVYTYRLENDDEEAYADVKCYIVDREKYSYCFIAIISDLTSTDKNIKEVNDIWESFNPEVEKE
ncbi:MAG: copper amine oxidase N-terminal domain-containing protein [Clostridia bacterium]|nr:copper amine oxidase N-terminal domain-containing protein [Clostridia bacterium]